MTYDAFSVDFGSLHFPRTGTEPAEKAMNQESLEMLELLFQSLEEKMTAARNPEALKKELEGSLFGCCFPEGMAVLRCTPDAARRTLRLDGFLVMEESLRTAWHLVRWKLLFVCAAGWNYTGMVRLSVSEIDRMTASLRAPQEYQKKLIEISQKMLASEMPFSFAMTDFPVNLLPLEFNESSGGNTVSQNSANLITLPAEEVQKKITEFSRNWFEHVQSIRLMQDSKKHYLSRRLEASGLHEDTRQLKASLKETLAEYPEETVWYFAGCKEGQEYLHLLSRKASASLSDGRIYFVELHFEMNRFISEMDAFFSAQEKERILRKKEDTESSSGTGEKKKTRFPFPNFIKKDKH